MMINKMADDDCLCGEPPYTDGKMCPACLELVAKGLLEDVKSGKTSPAVAIAKLFVMMPREDDEEES